MAFKQILQTVLVCVILQQTGYCATENGLNDPRRDPANYYTSVELACSEGYPVQEHKVVTRDGYVLTVHRIPNGRTRQKVPRSKNHYHKLHLNHHPDFDGCVTESLNATAKGFPVLFAPGLLMTSDGWLLQGPGSDLVYILADLGYDIWLINFRGTFYSRKHLTLSPSDPRFWEYSFHEHAVFDVPSTIDYILKTTKKDKVSYVGFSMGTTTFFAMASALPEINDKILGFIALAPVAYIKEEYMHGRRKAMFASLLALLKELSDRGNFYEMLPRNSGLANIAENSCTKRSPGLQDLCYDIAALFLGYPSKMVLRSKLHLYTTHLPSGTSFRTLVHYGQNIRANAFRRYDHGREKNLVIYGSPTPPHYPLWNITAPVALYYTRNDFFYDEADINDLRKFVHNVIDIDVKEKFNHADYLWAFMAKDIVYPKVVDVLRKLTEQYNIQTRKKKSVTKRRNFGRPSYFVT